MYNKIILVGNLTRDPELRYMPSGTAVASFTVAVNSKYAKDSEQKEETLFMPVVTFGSQAEACSQYLVKGSPVLIEGRLQEERWEKDGQKRSKIKAVANTVKFLGGKGSAQEAAAGVEPF